MTLYFGFINMICVKCLELLLKFSSLLLLLVKYDISSMNCFFLICVHLNTFGKAALNTGICMPVYTFSHWATVVLQPRDHPCSSWPCPSVLHVSYLTTSEISYFSLQSCFSHWKSNTATNFLTISLHILLSSKNTPPLHIQMQTIIHYSSIS